MLIPLKLVRGQPLQQQLYDQLRTLILAGRLQVDARMPSTRMLAEQFAISRITVILTYERLVAEGLLYTLPAAGTFVGAMPSSMRPAQPDAHPAASPEVRLEGPATVGLPDPELFPANRWRAALRHALDRVGAHVPTEDPAGAAALRQGIAGWLAASRGLTVAPEQVMVVIGRRRALDIAARLCICPIKASTATVTAVIESPCDEAVTTAYALAGARILPVPVDAGGLMTDRLPRGPVALAHVTAGHQNPLGVTLAPARRRALLEWATATDAMLIEEDQDADFRSDAALVPPLAAMDATRVIYAGGFAAAMAPWLQLAYLVVPPRLIGAAAALQQTTDEHAAWLEEGALAKFIDSGAFARHVHRARKTYALRRHALAEARARHLPDIELFGTDTGLHQAWLLPTGFGPASRAVDALRAAGLIATTVPPSTAAAMPLDRLVLVDVARCPELGVDSALAEVARDLATRTLSVGTLAARPVRRRRLAEAAAD